MCLYVIFQMCGIRPKVPPPEGGLAHRLAGSRHG